MSKPIVLVAATAAMMVGLPLALSSSADAGCRKHRHYRADYTPRYYAPRYDDDYRAYRPYRPAYWAPYRPAYIYYPAPYPARYAYGEPVCVRMGWTINRYGEPRWRCISW